MHIDFDLATVWGFLIAFAVFAYVVMDGFDLGIGILFPTLKVGQERNAAINSIAPVWDGNETWLVLGGGSLMAAFPLAFAIIMPALYAPIIAMVLGLVFRGIAFEFRARDDRHRYIWDFGFTAGSIVASLAQGISLGALLQGIKVDGRAYGGGWWDWLSGFSLLTGVAVLSGYTLLGACWLVLRTEGPVQDTALRIARWTGMTTVGFIVAVSAATPFLKYAYYKRWFAWPDILAIAPVPVLVGLIALALGRALAKRREIAPFLLTLALFGLCFVGLGISMFPYIVPDSLTIWQAAAPPKSQAFILVGASVLIPIILIYTAHAYWVFRGKVGHDGYH